MLIIQLGTSKLQKKNYNAKTRLKEEEDKTENDVSVGVRSSFTNASYKVSNAKR